MQIYDNYRDFLKHYYELFVGQGKVTLMKDFAALLNVSPSSMSEIMSGKHLPGPRTIKKISNGLNLSEKESALFLNLVRKEDSKNHSLQEFANKKIQSMNVERSYTRMSGHKFNEISNWYDIALYDQLKLPDSPRTIIGLAQKTGLEQSVVAKSISKLQELNMVFKKGGHFYARRNPIVVDSDDESIEAVQNYHREISKRSAEQLKIDTELREFSVNQIFVNKDLIPQIKEELRNFRRKLQKKYDVHVDKEDQDLYILSLQFFPAFEGVKE